MQRGKFIGRETIGRVAGLGLNHMKQAQMGTQRFRKRRTHGNHPLGGIGKINSDYNRFHGIFNKAPHFAPRNHAIHAHASNPDLAKPAS
jgi:hypothetical protein